MRSRREALGSMGVAGLIALIVGGTLMLWALHGRDLPTLTREWWVLLALAALTAMAQLAPLDIYGAGRISLSAALVMTGGVIIGIPGALSLAAIVALLQWVVGRGRFHRFLFDLGAVSLAAAAASTLAQAFAGRTSGVSGWILPVALGAGLSFYAVNIGLLTAVMAMSERRSPAPIWRERFQWLWAHYAAYGLLAGLIVIGFRAAGIYGLLVFALPLGMMRYVMKQYIDRTEENVRRLTEANKDLTRAHEEVSQALGRLTKTYDATLVALSAALDSRDSETEGHCQRVVGYCRLIVEQMGLTLDEVPGLAAGALLHDVGKIGVPDAILRKPGPLTEAEKELMRSHCQIGSRMLAQVTFLRDALPVIRHHHERYDGKGYPDGLMAHEIPLVARIFALADTFDAMTSNRPYRSGCSCEIALEEIARSRGSQFDPDVADAFLRVPLEKLSELSGQSEQTIAGPSKRAVMVGSSNIVRLRG